MLLDAKGRSGRRAVGGLPRPFERRARPAGTGRAVSSNDYGRPGAVFEVHPGENTEVIVCEGVENALSIYRYGKRRCRILGIPGIDALQCVKFPTGAKVTVFRDSDPDGSPAARALQRGLDHLILDGANVYVTIKAPDGYDANKILTEFGAEEIALSLDRAEQATLSLDGKIEELAGLDELEYEQVRLQKAKELGIRVSVLDDKVEQARTRMRAAQKPKDDWTKTEKAKGWPTPVDGTELLDDLAKTVGEHVIMTKEQAWCVAVWVMTTHAFAAAVIAAKLWITSAVLRSGKTRLMRVLKHLVARPETAEYITPSAIFRLIDRDRPTLLLDEVDTFIADSEDLRGLINGGFERDGSIVISVPSEDGWEPKRFSIFCPQALAGLGKLDPTNADRSFRIALERKPPGTRVKRLRRRDIGPLVELAMKAERWAADNIELLEDADPEIPKGLNDRAADAWELCLAIADLCGGHWPKQARKAALAISGDGTAVDESVGIELLSDIRDIFNLKEELDQTPDAKVRDQVIARAKELDRITSADLVRALVDMEGRPWPEYSRGKELTATQLAVLLKPFHIAPGLIRVITPGGGAGKPQKKPESGLSLVARGYKRNQFRKAFARYLPPLPDVPTPDPTQPENDPPDPPSSNPTPIFDDFAVKTLQPEDFCGSQPDFEPLQEDPCNTPKKSENASVSADCNVVTAKMPEIRVGAERVPSDRAVFESVKEYVCYLSERHPTWSVDRIAREIGTRNVERVARYMPERSVMPADEAREMLDYWVRERWAIRERRLQGLPRDRLTDDPILHEFKFCNVRRSDDATTRWIIEHITRPFATDPTLLTMFTIARLINLPDTLAELIATPKAWPGNRFEPSVV